MGKSFIIDVFSVLNQFVKKLEIKLIKTFFNNFTHNCFEPKWVKKKGRAFFGPCLY